MSLGMVDADVHHGSLNMVGALQPHLSQSYREQLEENGYVSGIGPFAHDGGVRGWRAEDVPAAIPTQQPPGGAVAWDIETTGARLFEQRGLELAILTGGPVYGAAAMPDLDYASAICRAFNNWTFETWLAADKRYRFAMSVCSQDPEGAVTEIDRIGSDPRVCAVLLPTASARHLGNRMFEPILKAAAAHDLPIALHAGGDGTGNLGPITSAGSPSHFIEEQMAQPGFYQVHLGSFVFEGVFDRNPTLKVAFLGSGFSWLPAYLWRMDNDWKALRYHTPWVRRLPSEYVFDHVRFGTQPLEAAPGDEAFPALLEWIRAEQTVFFASHFPHWDGEEPKAVAKRLPESLREAVFRQTAMGTFRL
jgi:predicted TIM-barrel fold metal-dependent hydrolase